MLFLFMVHAFSVYGKDAEHLVDPKNSIEKKEADTKERLFGHLTKEKVLSIISAIIDLVREKYVDKIDEKKILEGAINGILTSLDPHSFFFNAEDFKDLCERSKGEFGGLGMEVTQEKGVVKIISPIDDTPAYNAGLKGQDLIVAIDEAPVSVMSLGEAVKKMRGNPGTKVKLLIKREGEKPFSKELTRAIIQVKSVKWRTEQDVGYIRISTFDEKTTDMLREAIVELQKTLGDKLKGFVIDLRNNPGGRLDQAVSATNLFVDKGNIVSIRGRADKQYMTYDAEPGKAIVKGDIPVVVLINGNSASASEIMAGTLQDSKKALIVGESSFGKGSVQSLIPLGDNEGSEGGLKLTIARFYTSSGRAIQKAGITPDVEIAQIENLAIAEKLPFQLKEKDLPKVLSGVKPEDTKSETEKKSDPSEKKSDPSEKKSDPSEKKSDPSEKKDIITSVEEENKKEKIEDYQLLQALKIVKGISLYMKSFGTIKGQ